MKKPAFIINTVAAACLTVMVSGCDHMSNTQQRTLSGAGIGAGVGAAGAAVTGGCVGCGAAIGGAAGAGAGYLYDRHEKRKGNN